MTTKMSSQGKVQNLRFFLLIIIGLVLFVQLVKINRPYLGHFSSYQAGMMNIAQHMEREGASGWLYPKLSQITAGKPGLHLNQYLLPSFIAAICHQLLPLPYEFWGRIQMVFFHILSLWLFFLILRSLWTERIALLGALIYGLSPFTIIYGQSFMCESLAVFFFLWPLYIITRQDNRKVSALKVLISGFLFSIALWNRIHYLVMFLPILYLLIQKSHQKVVHVLLFSVAALMVPVSWYLFVYRTIQTHANIHMHIFMQMGAGKILTPSLLLSLDYYKHLFDVVSGVILTPLVFPFFLLGLFISPGIAGRGLVWVWLSTFLLLIVGLPMKVMDHEFYLYPTIPALFLIAAFGIDRTLTSALDVSKKRSFLICLLIFFLISARYFLHPLYVYGEKYNHILSIAEKLKRSVAQDELIIVAHGGAPELLYYSGRNGWTFNEKRQSQLPLYWQTDKFQKLTAEQVEERNLAYQSSIGWFEYLRKQGAGYFVAPNKQSLEQNQELFRHIRRRYQMLSGPEDPFYFFRLQK